jgi:hypothetical protein
MLNVAKYGSACPSAMLRRNLIGLLVLLLFSTELLGGSWMRSEKEYLYSISLSHSSADKYYDQNARLRRSSCTSDDYYINQSVDYGYSYYYTYFAHLAMAHSSCGSESENDLGDIELGIRGRINLLRNGRSWEVSLIIPTGNSTTNSNELGAGELGVKLGLHGRFEAGGMVNMRHFLKTGADLRYLFTGNGAERLSSYLEYTLPWNQFDIDLGIRGNFSLDGSVNTSEPGFSRTSDDYREVSTQLSLSHKFSKWSVGYRLSQVIWGENTDASTSLGISLSRRWEN